MNNTNIIEQMEESNPLTQITERELDMLVIKMGSFLSIISNKKINQVKLLITTIQNKLFQQCFLKITDMHNLQALVQYLLRKYPTLCKSKVIYKALIKNVKSNNPRKKSI